MRGNLTALVAALEKHAYSKQMAPNPDALNWTFSGSLFFAITIMTTIGYGTFVPYTAAGEFFVVVFGFFGLAVSGVCVAVLNNGFDAALAHVGKSGGALAFLSKSQHAKSRGSRTAFYGALVLGFWVLTGCIFAASESWSFATGFYYSFVTFTTIGFGKYVISYGDRSGPGLVAWIILIIVGMIVFAKAIEEVADLISNLVTVIELPAPQATNTEAPTASNAVEAAPKKGDSTENDGNKIDT